MLLINQKNNIKIFAVTCLKQIVLDDWNRLNLDKNPFLLYEFLTSLEQSNSVEGNSGWKTFFIIATKNKKLVGALPNYLKFHSYGEYIFDTSWANAHEKSGINYYPKMLVAIPFTPVPGNRILVSNENDEIIRLLLNSLIEFSKKNNISSIHINFISEKEKSFLKESGWMIRKGIQFHWHNKNYSSFNDFLSTLSSRKRKNIRKEREFIKREKITFKKIFGESIKDFNWKIFYKFYLSTIEKKWGGAYLKEDFFELIGKKMSDNILLVIAEQNNTMIAGALNFIGNDKLYGRNWGTVKEIPYLHFETCYYQAIEFAIAHNLKKVEAGVQGMHKVQRGYVPTKTYSAHWINNNVLSKAIDDFLKREDLIINSEIEELSKLKPYKTN